MIFERILAPFGGKRRNQPVLEALYGTIMSQARQPDFYTVLKVPDTLDGRFDMLTLHTYLVVTRLHGGGEEAQALSQDLFDHMFKDMDHVLREMGVGDMGISKRIQKLAAKFYGRAEAYEAAMASDDNAQLEEAIGRNVFAATVPPAAEVSMLAAYVREARSLIASQSLENLSSGVVHFPAPVDAKGA